jgi:hypothetical protein
MKTKPFYSVCLGNKILRNKLEEAKLGYLVLVNGDSGCYEV